MDTYFNIYEKLEYLELEILSLKNRIERYESLIQANSTKNQDHEDNLTGYYTINDIIRKYNISRQCFYNYRKLVPLKKSARIGRFNRYRKLEVEEFLQKISELKRYRPELFFDGIIIKKITPFENAL